MEIIILGSGTGSPDPNRAPSSALVKTGELKILFGMGPGMLRRRAQGMEGLGFKALLPGELQSPIITSFKGPTASIYSFQRFYESLKAKGFVIYPGKVTEINTFHIGHLFPEDIDRLVSAIKKSILGNRESRLQAA